ncbi:MAG TPA: hypothetical protein VGN95_18145, partial [Pyrinomonadaceae bacterium]|nr:hypothetical protein [Pyrinomonadaceae bacterium]
AIRFKGNGTIFTGAIINSAGVQSGKEIVVRCTGNVLSPRDEVFRGEVWEVEGFQEIYRGRIQLRGP